MKSFNFLRQRPRIEMFAVLAMVLLLAVLVHHAPHAAGIPITGLGFGFAGMIIDSQCVLSDAQALTVTAVSTNTYDTAAAGNAFDVGEPMCIAFSVDVAAKTSDSNETYQFGVIQSANADLSSADVLIADAVAFITKVKLVAGYRFYLPIPPGMKTKRYLGAAYTLGGTNPTITVTAVIQPLSMIQNDYINANGFTINS